MFFYSSLEGDDEPYNANVQTIKSDEISNRLYCSFIGA